MDSRTWVETFVRLNREGRLNRVPEMGRWDGFVVGVREFPLIDGDKESLVPRLLVDWGQGRVWTEAPENLEKVK